MHIIIKDRRPIEIRNKEKVAKEQIRAYYDEECAQNPLLIRRSKGELDEIKRAWETFPTDERV